MFELGSLSSRVFSHWLVGAREGSEYDSILGGRLSYYCRVNRDLEILRRERLRVREFLNSK